MSPRDIREIRIVFDDLSVRSADPEEGGEVAAKENRQPSGREMLGEAVAGLLGDLRTRGTRAVYEAKNPVDHKIVCQCTCWAPTPTGQGEEGYDQTFEERTDCGKLSGIGCTHPNGTQGKLGNCKKTSVPTRLAPEQVRGERLVVKSEP